MTVSDRLSGRLDVPTDHCLLLGGNHAAQPNGKGVGDVNRHVGFTKLGGFNPFRDNCLKRIPIAVRF